MVPFQIFYRPQIQALEAAGNRQAAVALCTKGLQTAPAEQIDPLLTSPAPARLEDYDLLLHFYEIYSDCAGVYARGGRDDLATWAHAKAQRMEAALDRQTLYLDRQNQ